MFTEVEQIKFLVPKFLKEQDLKKIIWPREMKIWKKLIKKAPFSYWEKLEIPFKLNSAAWFLSTDGVMYLKSLKPIKLPKIEENKQMEFQSFEIEGITLKPKTQKEFVGNL